MELVFAVGLMVVVVGVGAAIVQGIRRNEQANRFAHMPDFHASHSFISADGLSGIAVDDEQKKLCLIGDTAAYKIISYRDLLAFDVIQNGVSVTKTARASQAATAVLGGLMFGGIGALTGALTSKTVTHKKIKGVDLKLTINDITNPIFFLNFQNVEVAAGGRIHSAAMERVDEWVGRLSVLVRLADDEDRSRERERDSPSPRIVSVASEISKLAELRQQGLLTDTEFSQQKQKLLGRT